jgi:hypothetical protein
MWATTGEGRDASAYLVDEKTGAVTPDRAQLYYSPSSRCVYGKYLLGGGRCQTASETCAAQMTLISPDGSVEKSPICYVSVEAPGCTTFRADDAGRLATVEAVRLFGVSRWYGKTEWW